MGSQADGGRLVLGRSPGLDVPGREGGATEGGRGEAGEEREGERVGSCIRPHSGRVQPGGTVRIDKVGGPLTKATWRTPIPSNDAFNWVLPIPHLDRPMVHNRSGSVSCVVN